MEEIWLGSCYRSHTPKLGYYKNNCTSWYIVAIIAWVDGCIGENIIGLKCIAYRGIMRCIKVTHTNTVGKLLRVFAPVPVLPSFVVGNGDFHLFNGS